MQQGGNAPIGGPRLTVSFAWTPASGRGVEADASAYLLTVSGKVRGDHDMVFYNQPDGANGSVRFRAEGGGAFDIDLEKLPETIERVVFCLTIDEAQAKGHTLALVDGAQVIVSHGTETALRFRPNLADASEAAMIFGELYRRGTQWKFRSVGQGFNGGLAPLARSFGIDVGEDAAEPPPPLPAGPVSLNRVVLDESNQAIVLEAGENGFGEILVNLNWSRGRKSHFAGGTAIDLDLGCLVEMSDGRKGAVQAIGQIHGHFDEPPFMALSGDDRTGDLAEGETLRINGRYWSAIRRIAIFANIYDGVPDWQQTDGLVLVTTPGQPPIEIRMTQGRNDRRLCGVALIENEGGRLKATRVIEYFPDQQQLDERFGWGMRWRAGSKDRAAEATGAPPPERA